MQKNIKSKSNIEHLWSILCASSAIDFETNNVTISNIIEDLSVVNQGTNDNKEVAEGILVPVNFQIVSLWRKVSGDSATSADVRLEFVDPSGKILNSNEFKLDIPEDKKRMRQRVNIPVLQITSSGEYFYKISYREDSKGEFKHIYSIPLMINSKQ